MSAIFGNMKHCLDAFAMTKSTASHYSFTLDGHVSLVKNFAKNVLIIVKIISKNIDWYWNKIPCIFDSINRLRLWFHA